MAWLWDRAPSGILYCWECILCLFSESNPLYKDDGFIDCNLLYYFNNNLLCYYSNDYTLHKTSLRYFRVLERFIHQDALDYLDERLFVFLHSSFDSLFTACFTFLLCTNWDTLASPCMSSNQFAEFLFICLWDDENNGQKIRHTRYIPGNFRNTFLWIWDSCCGLIIKESSLSESLRHIM